MKQNIKTTYILLSIGLFIFLTALFGMLQYSEYVSFKKDIEFTQNQIARRIQQLISTRVHFLTTVANNFHSDQIKSESSFHKFASQYVEAIPEFYAINWIEPSGVIRWVYPESKNSAAKNQNLMNRPEIKPYLDESLRSKSYTISHFVKVYQGFKGVTFYYPIFKEDFVGWLNGIFTYQSIINEFSEKEGFENYNILIRNKNSALATYELTNESNTSTAYNFKILNQDYEIFIEHKKNYLLGIQKFFPILLYSLSLILASLMLRFSYKSEIQNEILQRANTKLQFSNSIVGVLTHDFANQVQILDNHIQRFQKDPQNPELLTKIQKNISNQISIIKKVNDIRRKDFRFTDFENQKTDIIKIINDSIKTFEDSIHAKKLFIQVRSDEPQVYIITDPLYFQNNVINNLLTNSIKYSQVSGKIDIYTYHTQTNVIIEFRDYGIGIPQNKLDTLLEPVELSSTRGTAGEKGSGLGLLQVKTFVGIFKGQIEIISGTQDVQNGTLIILKFPLINCISNQNEPQNTHSNYL